MNKTKRNKSNPGMHYEEIVANIHRLFSDNAVVTENELIVGKSGRERQIDVALRTDISGYSLLVIIECKDYKRRVEIGKIDELIGKIDDVGAAKGILVSDSGFSIGAIERAKVDNRIQLASVIDTENGKLRSRIHTPIHLSSYELQYPFNLELNVEMSGSRLLGVIAITDAERALLRDRELNALEESHIIDLIKRFYVWCGAIAGVDGLKAGVHEFEDIVISNSKERITAKIIFTKTIRRFVNDNIYMRGIGIYDHVNKSILKGDASLKSVSLNRDEIFATWREVPEDYVLANCQIYYALVASYNIDSAEEMGHSLFANIKAMYHRMT